MSTPPPAPSGPPLRALAMVLIALAIAFAGIGAMVLSGSDSNSQPAKMVPSVAPVQGSPNNPAASARSAPPTSEPAVTTTDTTTDDTMTDTAGAGTVDKSAMPLRVFNNSTVSGLAAQTASTLEADGWSVSETGNYSSGNVSKTTVYYAPNSAAEKDAALEIASKLGIAAEPRFAGIASSSPGVIVIVTS